MSKTGNRVTNFLTRIGNFALDPFSGGTAVPEMIKESKKNKRIPFYENFTPLGSTIDTLTLGATDLDKKGDNQLQKDVKNLVQKTKEKIFNETGTVEKPKLGDSFNQNQFMKDLYGLQAQQSILRDYEMGREAKRNMAAAQQYLQLTSMAAESAARRRLMEDQFSPTKISQQRLRAQQGEAALMNAISNQQNAATNAARSGINPRGRAGGA